MNLLLELKRVNWEVAFRTYGNNHSTLIGLLVNWWITGGPFRWALEGGPSIGMISEEEERRDRRACDAILSEGGKSLGALEVEGSRHIETIEKLGGFFSSRQEDLATLQFGLFLGYHSRAVGRGAEREVEPLPAKRWAEVARGITERYPAREIVLLGMEKEWRPEQRGPRSRSEYYQCHPIRVWGLSVRDGVASASLELAVVADHANGSLTLDASGFNLPAATLPDRTAHE